ncbi:hypothetical protein OIU85_000341 [Salix viminalis]|uniref:Uncharacterized protein n=1 Tax=Salix viminalis TaxID=40686 RepID=A0A9Q0ZWX4_SALVM|nr:hypothetical protein OIU85_000341 [Salix viminalis]
MSQSLEWWLLESPCQSKSGSIGPGGDTDENRTRNEAAETSFSRNDVKDIPKPGPITPGVNMKVNVVDWRAQELVSPNTPIDEDISGNYEEPQGEIQRPGLCWTEATEGN